MRPLNVTLPFALLLAAAFAPLRADDAVDDVGKSDATTTRLPGQIGDDDVLPLDPANPRDEAAGDRVDAMGWFMKGRIQESRNEFNEALESYEKALELDPKAIEVYRVYVPLAFRLRRTEEAVERALVLVELDPDNPTLMQQLGRDLARRGRLDEAIELLEKAAEAPSLKKRSAAYVSLNRDLSVLYGAAGNTEKLADAYEVVFGALVNPDRYELDMAVHGALERDRAVDYERMGEAFLEAKRLERAATAFTIAADRAKGKPSSLNYNLARLHLTVGDAQKALSSLETYLDAKLQGKGREAYELLAEILTKLERSDELVPKLEKLAKRDGRNNLLLVFLADQYAEAERYDSALETYEKVVDDNGDASGYPGLARIHRRQGNTGPLLDALVKTFEGGRAVELQEELEAITGDAETLEALVAEGRKRTEGEEPSLGFVGSLVLASLSGEAERTDDAITFYEYALTKAEPRQKSAVYRDLASNLVDAEKYGRAIEVLDEAVKSVTEDAQKAQFLYELSRAQELAGDTQAALATIADARRLMPDNSLLHYQQGWIHYHASDWKAAAAVFEEVLETYAGEEQITRAVRFSLSNVYIQMDEMRKAEQVLEVVLEAEPDDPSVNNDLGYLYADQGKNLEQAEKMIRKAIEAEPENTAYMDSMGWVLYRLEKYDEALVWLEKAVADPDGADPTLWDHLADCYAKLGRKDDAVKTWQKALDAFDEDRPDEKRRSEIKAKLKKAKAGE